MVIILKNQNKIEITEEKIGMKDNIYGDMKKILFKLDIILGVLILLSFLFIVITIGNFMVLKSFSDYLANGGI